MSRSSRACALARAHHRSSSSIARARERSRGRRAAVARDGAAAWACPCCGDARADVAHLALCAPDELEGKTFDDVDGASAMIATSVIRRHGEKSTAYAVLARRFGWDGERRETSARRLARSLGIPMDIVVKMIRREVKATPMGLGVSASDVESLEILYEDEATGTVAVNKIAGKACTPTNRLRDDSMASRVVAWWTKNKHRGLAMSSTTPFVVHRLDLETSGALIVAKDKTSANALQSAFENRRVQKTYLALCDCASEEEATSSSVYPMNMPTIEYAIEKNVGVDGRAAVRCVVDDDDAKNVRASGASVKILSAKTDWRILERRGKYALIEARPQTGRTHQVRAHLAAVGWPIVGDTAYRGANESKRSNEPPLILRHALHAYTIKFDDGYSKLCPRDVIVAPAPEDFIRACRLARIEYVFDRALGAPAP